MDESADIAMLLSRFRDGDVSLRDQLFGFPAPPRPQSRRLRRRRERWPRNQPRPPTKPEKTTNAGKPLEVAATEPFGGDPDAAAAYGIKLGKNKKAAAKQPSRP